MGGGGRQESTPQHTTTPQKHHNNTTTTPTPTTQHQHQHHNTNKNNTKFKPSVAFLFFCCGPHVCTFNGHHDGWCTRVRYQWWHPPWRRRQRRLRAFRRFVLWHSKVEMAVVLHHFSRQRTHQRPAPRPRR